MCDGRWISGGGDGNGEFSADDEHAYDSAGDKRAGDCVAGAGGAESQWSRLGPLAVSVFAGRWSGGRLAVWFSVEPDSVESYGKPVAWAISSDSGRTWQMQPNKPAVMRASEIEEGTVLPNGDRYGAVPQCAANARGADVAEAGCVNSRAASGMRGPMYPADAVPATLTTWVFERLPAGGEIVETRNADDDDSRSAVYGDDRASECAGSVGQARRQGRAAGVAGQDARGVRTVRCGR